MIHLLVIIEIVYQCGISTLEVEGHTPVAINCDGPHAFWLADKLMQAIAGQAHILGVRALIQPAEHTPELGRMCGLDAFDRTCHKEITQPFMLKRFYHGLIITCYVTGVNELGRTIEMNNYSNGEHYRDSTAGQAISRADGDKKHGNPRLSAAMQSVRATFRIFGFDVVDRIVLVDRKTGKIYR